MGALNTFGSVVFAALLLASTASAVSLNDVLNFALNLEYLEANFYYFAAYGTPIPAADRGNGPVPTGPYAGKLAQLSPPVRLVAESLATVELEHVRTLRKILGKDAVPQPLLNLRSAFQNAANLAVGKALEPAFDPYGSDITFLLGSFLFEDVGVTAYHGALPLFVNNATLLAAISGFLAVEAYHGGFLRSSLFQHRYETLFPYSVTVSKLPSLFSRLRAAVSGAADDKGIIFDGKLVIAPTDPQGVVFSRTTTQVLAILYEGSATKPGGFFPNGLNGSIR